MADFGLTTEQLEFTPETIRALVNRYTDEKGVRGLSASIRELISRLNLIRLLNSGKKKSKPGETNAALEIISYADTNPSNCSVVTVDVLNKVLPEIRKANPVAHMYV
jgi:ATP-dependent Lon protease